MKNKIDWSTVLGSVFLLWIMFVMCDLFLTRIGWGNSPWYGALSHALVASLFIGYFLKKLDDKK